MRRIGEPGAPAVVNAFLRRDALVALSQRFPFLFDAVSVVFVLLEFVLLAKIVPQGEVVGGYLSFAVTGLVVMAFVAAGVSVVAGVVRQEQVQGTLEVTLSVGLSPSRLALGLAAYPVVSGTVRAAALVGVAAAVGARVPSDVTSNWLLAAVSIAIGSVSFVGLGIMMASLVLVFRQAAAGTAWLLSALTLTAGAIFPVRLLPSWAVPLASLSPVTQTLRLVRRSVLEGASFESQAAELGVLVLMAGACGVLAVVALTSGLRRAKRAGGLAQY